MKVKDCADFKKEFPEIFHWNMLDSVKTINICDGICVWIDHEMHKPAHERNEIAGLRRALNIIAELADI